MLLTVQVRTHGVCFMQLTTFFNQITIRQFSPAGNFRLSQAIPAVAQGFMPSIISSDGKDSVRRRISKPICVQHLLVPIEQFPKQIFSSGHIDSMNEGMKDMR